MPIWLLGISIRRSNLEFVTLKVESSPGSSPWDYLGLKVDLLQSMPSLPLFELIVGQDPTIQWQYNYHKFFYPSLTHAMSAALVSHTRKWLLFNCMPLSVKTNFRILFQSSPVQWIVVQQLVTPDLVLSSHTCAVILMAPSTSAVYPSNKEHTFTFVVIQLHV